MHKIAAMLTTTCPHTGWSARVSFAAVPPPISTSLEFSPKGCQVAATLTILVSEDQRPHVQAAMGHGHGSWYVGKCSDEAFTTKHFDPGADAWATLEKARSWGSACLAVLREAGAKRAASVMAQKERTELDLLTLGVSK